MADIDELKRDYATYKNDKAKYEKELYLKENKENDCIEKILINIEELKELGLTEIQIDRNKLNDKEYLIALTESILKVYDNYLIEADKLMKDR